MAGGRADTIGVVIRIVDNLTAFVEDDPAVQAVDVQPHRQFAVRPVLIVGSERRPAALADRKVLQPARKGMDLPHEAERRAGHVLGNRQADLPQFLDRGRRQGLGEDAVDALQHRILPLDRLHQREVLLFHRLTCSAASSGTSLKKSFSTRT